MKKLLYLFVFVTLFSCSKDDIVTPDEQLTIDETIIDNYLSKNNIEAEEHYSGIRFVHNVIGTGENPELSSTIYAKISSHLLDGSIFYESLDAEVLKLSTLIDALQLMVPEMKEGSNMTIYAPSVYCFGTQSSATVPKNSIIIFDIELISIIEGKEDQLAIDTLQIDKYLEANDIVAFIHESGIRYTVQTEGLGANPSIGDEIEVKYKGQFFNGSVFDENTDGITFPLNGLIEAWKIMIPTMKVGGKITIYAPSIYCYGSSGVGSIPPNTNLIFEINLLSIE